MQTNFTDEQKQRRSIAQADSILRKCVHCGFCTATCPTYLLLGDELDSPRGRIYLIKDMLEKDKPANEKIVKHIDRCLSCLSCMTTCPSGVDYMHLVDQARIHIEKTYARPMPDRLMRRMLAEVMPYPGRFRAALRASRLGRPLAAMMPARMRAMLESAPKTLPPATPTGRPGVWAAAGTRKMRVALLTGCVQPVLQPEINEATVRLLTRLGAEVVVPKGQGCCGALVHHLGKEEPALGFVRANVAAWTRELEGEGLDAIVVNASGCGTTVKDYGHMLAADPQWADKAKRIAALARDVSEVIAELGLIPREKTRDVQVAYHAACSLQHGQKIRDLPKALLAEAGFTVREPVEPHICCGSAGTYSLMQPDLSNRLQARKSANLEALKPDVIATGNIGCLMHIGEATRVPIVHTVQLLDWATGGPKPPGLT
ncbi:glycolate oxidase subunit GlcF [Novispirillum sp. DQ9]|uniref:glycolate oxidase subunit GlcF n=1 Tax=Novispirillum sp. DQ9 TaxID=3398612 RepID=UPI003C7EB4EB